MDLGDELSAATRGESDDKENSLYCNVAFLVHYFNNDSSCRGFRVVRECFKQFTSCFSTGRTRIVTTDCEGSHTIVLVWVFAVVAPRQETASVILVYRVENHETTSTKLLVSWGSVSLVFVILYTV